MARKHKPFAYRGWWTVWITLPNGTRQRQKILEVSQATQQEALREWERRGGSPGKLTRNFNQDCLDLIEEKSVNGSPRTREDYTLWLRDVRARYGKRKSESLTPEEGIEWKKAIGKLGLSPTTLNHWIMAVKAVFNRLVRLDRLGKNPWAGVKKFLERQRERLATDEEVEKILKAALKHCRPKRSGILMYDLVLTMRLTGLRPGELAAMKVSWVDLRKGLIQIPPGEHKSDRISGRRTERPIPIQTALREILERRGDHPSGLVFPDLKGKKWGHRWFDQRFKRLLRILGMDGPDEKGEKLCPYSLRHSRATEMVSGGHYSMSQVMSTLGHLRFDTTRRYVHEQHSQLVDAARKEEGLKGK